MTYIPDLNDQAHRGHEAGNDADFEVSLSSGMPIPTEGQIVRLDGQEMRVVRTYPDPINEGVTFVAVHKL